MQLNQKDLVLIPYPFSDLTKKKVRPALIISNNFFNKKSRDCIMLPLTTVLKDEPYSILINQSDISSGKLLKSSRIRADKIFCVEKNLIVMKIGTLKEISFQKIKKELLEMF